MSDSGEDRWLVRLRFGRDELRELVASGSMPAALGGLMLLIVSARIEALEAELNEQALDEHIIDIQVDAP